MKFMNLYLHSIWILYHILKELPHLKIIKTFMQNSFWSFYSTLSFASLSVIHVECISSNSPFLLPFVELKQTSKQTNMHIFFDLNFSILIPTQADLGLRSNNKEAAHGFFFLFLLNSDNNFSKYKFTTRSVSISFWKSLVLEVWEYNFLVPFK